MPTLTYEWSASSGDYTVDYNPNKYVEDPVVTITKNASTDDATTVVMVLTITHPTIGTVTDKMYIDVYDDSCKAAVGNGHECAETDIDSDCVVRLGDFAELAKSWLVEYQLEEPAVKP